MNEQVFIVTWQQYHVSCDPLCVFPEVYPIVGVWLLKEILDDFLDTRFKNLIANGFVVEHKVWPYSCGPIERYLIKNKDGNLVRDYSVYLERVRL